MRILMLNYEFPPLGGGAANANYYLLKEFSKHKDLEIDLITSSSKNKFEIEKFSSNIRIYKLNIGEKNIHNWKMFEIVKWFYKTYFFSRKLVKENSYNICHCWFGWPSGMIGYSLKNKIPYIVALRGSDVPGYNPRLKVQDALIFKYISKIVWKNAKHVIANSESLKSLAQKTLDIEMQIIPNGVDTNEFKPLKNKKIGKKIKLISTGRLIERKGYKYLISALELQNEFELTLIGEGDQEQDLKKLAKDLNVKVTFKGALSHSEISKELQKADVFVLPSLNEGMSNSILEAMACGLPVITTDTGGTKTLINNNGYLVQKQDAQSIEKALSNYLSQKQLLVEHSLVSRQIAEELGWNYVANKYLEEYKK